MLKVHKMPLKNQFLTGISSRYDKTPNQNEPQPFTSHSFTGDCTVDFLGKESRRSMTSAFTGTGILYNTMINPDAEIIPFDRDFDYTRFNFEIETAKNNNFMEIFTSYQQA
jgi:hypothetical protein